MHEESRQGAGVNGIEALYESAGESDSKKSLRAWLFLLKCSKRIEQDMSDRFREHFGSSLSRFDVLAHLDLAGEEGLSTSQLARRLLASKGNITRLLDRMEDDGLITRKQHATDRRVSRIVLSARGARLFSSMAPAHEQWAHEILSVLPPERRDELVQLLRIVRDHLNALR
jgi:DNA-binding MarR family transcriptional regulator